MNDRLVVADLPTPNLTQAERDLFQRRANQLLTIPYCPFTPHPKQALFLLDFGRESLYGGAVGGAKSVAIMMAASQFLHVPGYDALLVRKTFMDLGRPGALMDLAEQWWAGKPGVKFDRQKHTYIFDCPQGGHSRIEFGGLDTVNDRLKYQGGRYHFVGFDELTQFPERDYTYLFSRMRRTSTGTLSQIPIRMRSTSNPGGPGHEWVYKRFIAQWEAWRRGEAGRPRRNFHPAILSDNPSLDRAEYMESLAELDPVTRAQLVRGDWNIRPDGRMFSRSWLKPITRDKLPGNLVWCRGWDMAATDPVPGLDPDWTAGSLVGVNRRTGEYYIADVRHWRTGPGDNDIGCEATADHDTRRVQQAMEQEPGASGKIAIRHYRVGAFRRSKFRAVPSSGKARGRTTTVSAGRKTPPAKIMAAGPLASKCEAGLVHFVVDGSYDHEAMLAELEIFPDGEHDDIVDSLSLAVNVLDGKVRGDANPHDYNDGLVQENAWVPEAMAIHSADFGQAAAGSVHRAGSQYPGRETWSPDRIRAEIDRRVAEAFAV